MTKKKKVVKKKKSISKKKLSEFSDLDKTVLCCVYCDSPSVHKTILNSKEHYYCLRCGKHHIHVNEKPLIECKELTSSRKTFTNIEHQFISDKRNKKFYIFLDNFYLRMTFRFISLLLLIGGIVFSFANFWTGILFIFIGFVSLWTAESL